MAINKKLKKFDNNGTYRNFLTTSDFQCPDVSSIGESNVPQNLDVEYNPCSMLFLNAKARLFPTATKINFVIDTIVDGTVGCWYHASTGGTVTKLSQTDLTFTSAYTQNRISNLTFNTIGESNLSDEYNTVYILSARSADGNSTATDECVQRGHIHLLGEVLESSGGSKPYQIKTAPGNPWKITNTNSWLTFDTLTGVGPTEITVTATEWTNTNNQRVGYVTIEYTDMAYSVQASIVQDKLERYFYVGNTLAEATTTACTYPSTIGSADTSDKYVYYKMTGYTLTNLTFSASTMFNSVSFNGTTQIKFNLIENPDAINKTGTIWIKSGSTVISQIMVSQQAKRIPYFYVGNTLAEATTTACTYPSTIGSADTSDKYVYYNTNLTNEEIATLTFEKSNIIDDVSFVTATTQIKFNCVENEEDDYFVFPDVGTNIRESVWKASRTFWHYPYETNMTGLSISYTDSWATVTLSNPNGSGTIDFSAPQNTTGVNHGPSNYYVQQNGINIATIIVEQTRGYVTFDGYTSHSAETITISSDETSFDKVFASTLSGLTISPEETYNWISGLGINTPFVDSGGGVLADPIPQSGSVSATTTVNDSNYDRTAIFDIKCNNVVVGKLTVKQLAQLKELTFDIISAGTLYFAETAASGTYSYLGKTIEYSKDNGVTWTTITSNSGSSAPSISVARGDKVYFRGNNDCYTVNSGNCYVVFSASTGTKVNISGNINSLIQKENFNSVTSFTKSYVFCSLFSNGNWLVSVRNLVFPTISITDYCYAGMFAYQTNLLDVPEKFPATTLKEGCYRSMFHDCSGIVNADYMELPAMTLKPYCYANMFVRNTSLVSTPALPATTLAKGCYNYMFYGCSALTTAPELPALTLVAECYKTMFELCRRIKYIKCLATNISANQCVYYFTKDVASSGRFVKHPNMTSWTTGTDGIPNGWTVEDAVL